MAFARLTGEFGRDRYSDVDVRRLQVLLQMERAGLPMPELGMMVQAGHLSLDFIEAAGKFVFTPLEEVTFSELSVDSDIPIELLATIRDALGGSPPRDDERVGQSEMAVLPLVQLQHQLGFRDRAIEQALRVYGDTMRRVAETEAEWFRTEIMGPMFARGSKEDEVGLFAAEVSPQLSEASDQAVMAIYHAQQGRAWLANIVHGIASALESAGLHTVAQTVPAMCFLDITGYTHLAAQQGDQAAADIAEQLRRVVERRALEYDGRAVKWLGDGVMLWFPTPGSGVMAAVKMVNDLAVRGLPPAHVGLNAGPVVFQEGDYYGTTVNVAARIGEFARPGEVLVSQEVVDLIEGSEAIEFEEVGPVDLKGLVEPIKLYAVVSSLVEAR
jgi:adenylate cyclase